MQTINAPLLEQVKQSILTGPASFDMEDAVAYRLDGAKTYCIGGFALLITGRDPEALDEALDERGNCSA